MNEKQKTTLVHAINHFGVEGQINKAVEEMGELITELSRRNLSRFDKDRVAEEVADALIMLEQLRIIFGASKVDGYIAEKLERLEKTINGDWRRQERMMPKGMGVHLRLEQALKKTQERPDAAEVRRCCLFCRHIIPSPFPEYFGPYCGITGQEIIGNPRLMSCGRFEPTLEEREDGSNE